MIFKLFKAYELGKLVYFKVLKPIYLNLRKDAYEAEDIQTKTRKEKDAVNKKSKRSHQRKTNIKGL